MRPISSSFCETKSSCCALIQRRSWMSRQKTRSFSRFRLRPNAEVAVVTPLGSTGHWPVPSGDSPLGTERSNELFRASVANATSSPFRPASGRTAQAGRLCYPSPLRRSRSFHQFQPVQRPRAGTELLRLDAHALEHGDVEVAQRRRVFIGSEARCWPCFLNHRSGRKQLEAQQPCGFPQLLVRGHQLRFPSHPRGGEMQCIHRPAGASFRGARERARFPPGRLACGVRSRRAGKLRRQGSKARRPTPAAQNAFAARTRKPASGSGLLPFLRLFAQAIP